MNKAKSNGAVFTGIVAAIAASSCCIPPVIAAIAGVGGVSSNLSWMEPLRPYLIGLAILAIGFAWYSHLKPKVDDECGCTPEKPKFFQRRGFLIGMTLFASISITFPYYSHYLIPDNKKETLISSQENLQKIEIQVNGMTCEACQTHVDHAVNELSGIVSVHSSYSNGNAIVEFDKTQTTVKAIQDAVNSTGYMADKTRTIE